MPEYLLRYNVMEGYKDCDHLTPLFLRPTTGASPIPDLTLTLLPAYRSETYCTSSSSSSSSCCNDRNVSFGVCRCSLSSPLEGVKAFFLIGCEDRPETDVLDPMVCGRKPCIDLLRPVEPLFRPNMTSKKNFPAHPTPSPKTHPAPMTPAMKTYSG